MQKERIQDDMDAIMPQVVDNGSREIPKNNLDFFSKYRPVTI